ncbi:type II toxin-antitoxin system RelE/ParE family toxin [Sphingobium sp. LB126]|uniref:type II toxin-antitoxin system RelE/ParE family toxin n=1 Tax=Sphingobium sp. LB126 TaxID=1983755 RepID=UPI001F5B2C5B|nr:type II toxin-antitoxin system RelE/ParE family toxin [Sphingobium sp. LB126]
MKGFGGRWRGRDHTTTTKRYVPHGYTVKFAEAVYVLHAFQKKSKQGKPRRSRYGFDPNAAEIRREHHRQHQTREAQHERTGRNH